MRDRRKKQRRSVEARHAAVRELPTVELRHHAVLSGRPGEERVAASVGPDGHVIALWAAARDVPALTSTTTKAGWATFPDPRTSRPVAARVSIHTPEPTTVADLRELNLAHTTVQPLPGGRTLVVGARSRFRAESPDRNAVIYDSEGNVVAEATVGDGIEHVLTTPTGHIWVGYFDEGVYGNYGWGEGEAPGPIGASGLVRFAPDLRADWHFPLDPGLSGGAISDCYALNVDGETAWTCYYTDFPIVRVRDDALTGWRNPVRGPKALAVEGSRAALLGGYAPERDRLAVGALEDGDFHVTGEYRVVLPDGQPLPAEVQLLGRGPDLHVLTGSDWYRLGLEHGRTGAAWA
ncbi:hypothetical protein ABZ901_34840 [Actinacidiphila alni]|uniref:hypothetical protein n=1 Tax=Actinacidiphila alni TaxID=380248 RepID=UPI003409E912